MKSDERWDVRQPGVVIFLLSAILIAGSLAAASEGLFVDSGQRLGSEATWDVATGDLDADGDIDVVTANTDSGALIWLNDGAGAFSDSGRRLEVCAVVAVADLDGDGALDVITAMWGRPLTVWWNDGAGGFSEEGTTRAGSDSMCFDVGDLDGDDDPDIYLGRASSDKVLMNTGERTFRDTLRRFGRRETGGVVIADMDGDGDSDVVAAGWSEPGHVWANDGTGQFTLLCEIDAAQLHIHDATTGDYERDGDTDVFFALAGGVCCRNIWLNDGTGRLTHVDQDFSDAPMQRMAAADVNADGWVDLAFGGWGEPPRYTTIWFGGEGGFTDSGLRIGDEGMSGGIEFADFDGDGDLDLFVGYHIYQPGSWDYLPHPNEVWMNTTVELGLGSRR